MKILCLPVRVQLLEDVQKKDFPFGRIFFCGIYSCLLLSSFCVVPLQEQDYILPWRCYYLHCCKVNVKNHEAKFAACCSHFGQWQGFSPVTEDQVLDLKLEALMAQFNITSSLQLKIRSQKLKNRLIAYYQCIFDPLAKMHTVDPIPVTSSRRRS